MVLFIREIRVMGTAGENLYYNNIHVIVGVQKKQSTYCDVQPPLICQIYVIDTLSVALPALSMENGGQTPRLSCVFINQTSGCLTQNALIRKVNITGGAEKSWNQAANT